MLTIRDYKDNEYPLLAVKTVNEELNGNHSLELKVPQQKNNNLDLLNIDKLWTVIYKTVEYRMVYIKKVTKGDSFYLDVRAIPLFYFDMDKQIIHENKDGHYTAKNALDIVFNGSGYQYILVDFVDSLQIEGFGKGETRLEMFKRLIERLGLEFYIVNKTVYLKKLIGNDTNFMYKYKLNTSNISQSMDASNFFTHIKGFGNFEEGSEDYIKEAKLKREYTSPLATVVGKYEGKPIVDGRIKDNATMDANMKKAVEDSLEISIDGNLHDVRSIYKESIPVIGDRVFLIDERINLDQEIRIVILKSTYDIKDKLIKCDVTFGSQNIRDRYKSNLNSTMKNFNALMRGEIKLPTWSLEEIARGMITKIHASENELKYGDFGIQAVDKNNPNNVFGLNSQGWYISQDGGRTARTIATSEGIVADAITTGTLRSVYIEGVEIYGSSFQTTGLNNHITITQGALSTYQNNELTSRLLGTGHHFYKGEKYGGYIGVIPRYTQSDKLGFSFNISNEMDFIAWTHDANGKKIYDDKLIWTKNDTVTGYKKGFTFNDNIYGRDINANILQAGSRAKLQSSINGARLYASDTTWFFINEKGQFGVTINGVTTVVHNPK